MATARKLGMIGRNVVRAVTPGRGPTLIAAADFVCISTSVQTARVLEPIAAAGKGERLAPTPRWPALGPAQLRSAVLRSTAVARWLELKATAAGLVLPADLADVLLRTAIQLERSHRFFDGSHVRSVVVASQHNAATRAVLLAARRKGIPSVYVPHAPVADNRFYLDLPVSMAVLRGPAEADWYVRHGVDADGLRVGGDPSVTGWPPLCAPSRSDVVFAPSPHRDQRLTRTIDLLAEVLPRGVEVCPHPRMDREQLRRQCPSNWSMSPVPSTNRRLAEVGASMVIQDGSGVGLEALAMGIPVIDVCPHGTRPNYPYLNSGLVSVVADGEELRLAVERAGEERAQAAERMTFARSWVAIGGGEAATACAAAIREGRGDGQATSSPVLLDGWA